MTWVLEQLLKTIGKHMLNECVTYQRLAELSALERNQVEYAAQKLQKNGPVKMVQPGCLRITKEGIIALESGKKLRSGPKGPQQRTRIFKDSLRTRVWRAIRIRPSFTIQDLIGLVTTGDEKDATSNIGKYLRALESAGYLIKMQKRLPGTALTSNGFARWRLDPEIDTGTEAPVWRMSKGTIYDPNNGKEITLLPVKSVRE